MSDTEAAKQLFFQALSFLDARDYPRAESCLRDALRFAPQSVSVLANLAVALIEQNKAPEALGFAERASSIDPKNIEALLVMAGGYARERKFEASLAACDRILVLEPQLAEIHGNRAAALNALHRYEEALAGCDRALALAPRSDGVHNNRGNALMQLRRLDDALLAYDQALGLKPDLAEAWAGRGYVLTRRKQYDDALAAFARAIALDQDLIGAWRGRAEVLAELRQFDEALAACAQAIERNPSLPGGWLSRGNVLSRLQRLDEASAAYDAALRLDPDLAEALKGRGDIAIQLNRYQAAFDDFDRAFALRPDLSYLEGERLHAKMHLCDWRDLDRECAHLLASIAAGKPASFPYPVLTIPSSRLDQRRCAEIYVSDNRPASAEPLWRGERYAHRRLRIAYLSPDFREHPVAYLSAGLFAAHDRSRFEIAAISFGPDDGSATRRRLVETFDRFVDVRDQSDRQVAALMQGMEIDIAVDLCGYTRHFRPNILTERPAPVQASYLGYPGTMGVSHIDYLIADHTLIPPDQRDAYTERIVYLPDSYQVNDRERRIAQATPSRADLGLPPQGFVFCCFNNSFKITPDVFEIWMELLRAIDGSVLWLLAGDPLAIANLRREAAGRAVSPDRLVFAPRLRADLHLARHRRADLFLDTFHYGAHTTASDALWTGVPVLTCCGATFASRVGASLLRSVELAELITSSPPEYQALALRLAREPQVLMGVREKLARNRATCALFDTVRFTRHIEAAFTTMCERSRRGDPPEDISIATID